VKINSLKKPFVVYYTSGKAHPRFFADKEEAMWSAIDDMQMAPYEFVYERPRVGVILEDVCEYVVHMWERAEDEPNKIWDHQVCVWFEENAYQAAWEWVEDYPFGVAKIEFVE